MHLKNSSLWVIPTGFWLSIERQRLSKTVADVAKAIGRHVLTVRAVEQNSRIIPPGWYDALRKLGMEVPQPTWPSSMLPYLGRDLERDMNTRTGLQHSRFWLSKQLEVPEERVVAVIRGNLQVPHDWLLKLGELGADVPSPVKMMLFPGQPAQVEPTPAPLRESVQTPAAAPTPAERRERPSIYFHWTEDGGLHFSMSAALLEQIPGVLKDVLLAMHQCGFFTSPPGRSTQAEGT